MHAPACVANLKTMVLRTVTPSREKKDHACELTNASDLKGGMSYKRSWGMTGFLGPGRMSPLNRWSTSSGFFLSKNSSSRALMSRASLMTSNFGP